MANDSPAAPLLGRLRRRRRVAIQEVSDLQWAPPYEPDETLPYSRTPEPWPPPPPARPEPPAANDSAPGHESAPASGPGRRRAVAIGAAVAVVAAWVGVAVFLAPGHTNATTAGDLNPPAPSNSFPQGSSGYGGGNRTSPRATVGVVQSVDGPTLSLLDGNGQHFTVHTTASTAFVKTVPVSVGRLAPGDTIVASGVYSQANTRFAAGRIAIEAQGGPTQGLGRRFAGNQTNSVSGTVTAINGDQLTLNGFDGTVLTVDIVPSATVTAPVPGSLRDIAPGQPIAVRGAVAGSGDIDAYQVQEGAIGSAVGVRPAPLNSTGSLGLTPGRAVQS